jgi:FtsP/CotA-like multicopper oxidase with cupredoxin domain
MICTSDTAHGTSPIFTLTTVTGMITMPDGNSVFMWGLSPGGAFQSPGPVLCVNQGDTVTVILHNTLGEATSLVFPGQQGVLADNNPAQPVFDGGGNVTSLTKVAAATGGSVTYSFVAGQPGSYIYESGTSPEKQIQMGLFGALIVRPTGVGFAYNPSSPFNYAYNSAKTRFSTANEYVMLFSEIDPELHQAVETGGAYDPTLYAPKYWMINGRSFPDTIAPNSTALLPGQPYSALVHIKPVSATNPDSALIHYLNVGTLTHAFHPHGNSTHIIARDGHVLEQPTGEDNGYDKFLIDIGAGEAWDATFNWHNDDNWSPANPIPVALPQAQNLTYKDSATWYSGSPYLGFKGALPNGVISYNQCGEYYHVWHSHALNEATNYGVGFGGMFTLVRIDPPTPATGTSCN